MKYLYKYSKYFLAMTLSLLALSCQDDLTEPQSEGKEGELKIAVDFGVSTYLSELPNTGEMGNSIINGKDYGLKNVGLYVYYTDDYENGILSRPYVRNMECTVRNGQLEAILKSGESASDKHVFIYDRMTVVAFYPYNESMNDPTNHFMTKKDEEKYPITRRDYSEQYYIPYRAQTETNPTISYYTRLHFYPKHTYKVELVVVSDNVANFPTASGLKMLPGIDPVSTTDLAVDGKREAWFDHVKVLDNGGGGSNVRQYVGYIFTDETDKNDLKKGDILLQSDKLTLIASQNVSVTEQFVYRYGYNMTTGEMFIPTSSDLVHDVPSLQSIKDKSRVDYYHTSYQVCDIDMSVAGNWTPLYIFNSRFDGGGHKLNNMTINTTDPDAGLFGLIQGNAMVSNVNLINPVINVNSTTLDTVYAGAIVARVNDELSDENKLKLLDNLPPGLSPVVREALLQEMMAELLNSQATIVGSRVENPIITVNGLAPRVGTVVGQAGNRDKTGVGNYKSRIWDTYSLGGSIAVNESNIASNAGSYVGGFAGINQGYITRSYATIDNIKAKVEVVVNTIPEIQDYFTGFATMGKYFKPADGGNIENSFSMLPDSYAGVHNFASAWPSGWITYSGIWPVYYIGWLANPASSFWYSHGSSPSTYPTLHWQRR